MIDFDRIKTYPLGERKNKVRTEDFITLPSIAGLPPVEDLFPPILQGQALRQVIAAIAKARQDGKSFILMMGAHAIKNGLSPLLIEMAEKGIITHIATNGAGAIHDFEIALIGATSEDVGQALEDGTFGMAYETGHYLNQAYREGADANQGMGRAQAEMIENLKAPHRHHSLFHRAFRAGVSVTVHTSIGTDIIHQHPGCSGEALGKTSYQDFKDFAGRVALLEGGVVMNLGSAVLMPEVFLKALTVCRNLGQGPRSFTAVNMDMLDHYRPRMNVLDRPTSAGGRSFFLQGHMEILLPLLVYGVFQKMGYEFGAANEKL
jgi:hypothetical protein